MTDSKKTTSILEDMAEIGRLCEEFLKPLADESRRDTREQIARWQGKAVEGHGTGISPAARPVRLQDSDFIDRGILLDQLETCSDAVLEQVIDDCKELLEARQEPARRISTTDLTVGLYTNNKNGQAPF